MTRKQVKNLCAEFGMEMVVFPRRIYYCDYLVGSYYPDKDSSYKMSFIGSCVKTDNYETARTEIIKKIKDIKEFINQQMLEKIKEDFK
jgi:hypothetical protein